MFSYLNPRFWIAIIFFHVLTDLRGTRWAKFFRGVPPERFGGAGLRSMVNSPMETSTWDIHLEYKQIYIYIYLYLFIYVFIYLFIYFEKGCLHNICGFLMICMGYV